MTEIIALLQSIVSYFPIRGEPKFWVNKVFDMQFVVRKSKLLMLPAIESKDKQRIADAKCKRLG
jgi:hypothetical protein